MTAFGVADAGDDVGHRLGGAADQAGGIAQPLGLGQRRVRQQLQVAGHVLDRDRLHVDLAAGGVEVEQGGHQLRAAGAVDRGVVDLGDETEAVVLEALDHPRLPQGTGAVDRRRGDLPGQSGQLTAPAGRRAHHAVHVGVEVEVGVLDPHGVVEVEGDLDQAPPERGDQGDPLADRLLDRLEAVAAGHRRGVVDAGHGHVHVPGRRLQVQERGVHSRQSFHLGPS